LRGRPQLRHQGTRPWPIGNGENSAEIPDGKEVYQLAFESSLLHARLRRYDLPAAVRDGKNLVVLVLDEAQETVLVSEDGISDYNVVDKIRGARATTINSTQSPTSYIPPMGTREKADVFLLNLGNKIYFTAAINSPLKCWPTPSASGRSRKGRGDAPGQKHRQLERTRRASHQAAHSALTPQACRRYQALRTPLQAVYLPPSRFTKTRPQPKAPPYESLTEWLETIVRLNRENAEDIEFYRKVQDRFFIFGIEIGQKRTLSLKEVCFTKKPC